MKCLFGHHERQNHDITSSAPIKMLSLKYISAFLTLGWFDMGDSWRAVCSSFHVNTDKQTSHLE